MDKIDIKIIQLHKQEGIDLTISQLLLEISGETVNYALVNTLRRVALEYIPTYAFSKDMILIEEPEHPSIFDNDYMKLRIAQLTIANLNIPFSFVPEIYWRDINYNDPKREKFPEDKKRVEIYINVTNETNDVLNVTTNDIKYLEDDEEKANKFNKKFPCLIIQLRPKEAFKCKAEAVLGVGKRDNIWAAAGDAYYEEINSNRYKLTLESQGQLDEYDILYKGCEVVKIKLQDIKKIVAEKYNSPAVNSQNKLIIRLENEDHTIGNIINTYLKKNKGIAFAGLTERDLLQEEVEIKLESVKPNPIPPLMETIDYITSIMMAVQAQLVGLGKKFIQIPTVPVKTLEASKAVKKTK